MGKDVLSQSEIDSIINAISSGDLEVQQEELLEPDNITLYDFRKPNKFSKDQIRTLKNIHEIFARMLSNFLTAYLRTPSTVKLESITQGSYDEFIYSLPLPTLITVFRFSETSGSAFLETNPQFTFPIIDILFGGTGKIIKENRDLTEIELSVLKRVNEKIFGNLRYAWENIIPDIAPVIDNMDTNPQFSQLLASNEAVSLLTFSTSIADNDSIINLCLPYITLEPFLAKLSAQNWYNRQTNAELDVSQTTKLIENKLLASEVKLTAILGSATISVFDFLNFDEGDIIILNNTTDKPVDLLIQGKKAFSINLGVNGNKMAGLVTEVISEEEKE